MLHNKYRSMFRNKMKSMKAVTECYDILRIPVMSFYWAFFISVYHLQKKYLKVFVTEKF